MSFAPYGAIYRVESSVTAHQLQGQTAAQTTCSRKSNPDCSVCVSVWHPGLKGRWYHYDHFIVLLHILLSKAETEKVNLTSVLPAMSLIIYTLKSQSIFSILMLTHWIAIRIVRVVLNLTLKREIKNKSAYIQSCQLPKLCLRGH